MLVSTKEMLIRAQQGRFAIPAFNIENMEMARSVVETADRLRSPVILQTTPGSVRYAGLTLFYAIASDLAARASVPVALHLDHGDSFALCVQAVRAGYTSVMIDGSKLPLEENIALTCKVVEMAETAGVPVEGELGAVGGKEDTHEVKPGEDIYTTPDEAERFAIQTRVASFAMAIGTAHGFYQGEPRLDFDRLAGIRARVSVPLVLHGASGVPDDAVRRCIALGCCKVNFATELRVAFTDGVRASLADAGVYDPKVYCGSGIERVGAVVAHKIDICGSAGMGTK